MWGNAYFSDFPQLEDDLKVHDEISQKFLHGA